MPKIIATYTNKNGETKTLTEWSRIYGINRTTLHDRIYKLGYSFENAIKTNGRISKCKLKKSQ